MPDSSVGQSATWPAERWWICEPGGVKKLGPFDSTELALKVRTYVEAVERRVDLSVEKES